MSIDELIAEMGARWLAAKEAERRATEERRKLEDDIAVLANVRADLDGTKTVEVPGYTIKIVGRIDRKVDSDLVQELAAEHGLTDHLSSLFRWKPEVNASAWKSADPSITGPLAAAITAKPGRPSFSIEPITTKE